MAQCLEVDVASQGESEGEALANLGEALELHFEPPVARVHTPRLKYVEQIADFKLKVLVES